MGWVLGVVSVCCISSQAMHSCSASADICILCAHFLVEWSGVDGAVRML